MDDRFDYKALIKKLAENSNPINENTKSVAVVNKSINNVNPPKPLTFFTSMVKNLIPAYRNAGINPSMPALPSATIKTTLQPVKHESGSTYKNVIHHPTINTFKPHIVNTTYQNKISISKPSYHMMSRIQYPGVSYTVPSMGSNLVKIPDIPINKPVSIVAKQADNQPVFPVQINKEIDLKEVSGLTDNQLELKNIVISNARFQTDGTMDAYQKFIQGFRDNKDNDAQLETSNNEHNYDYEYDLFTLDEMKELSKNIMIHQ